MNHVYPTELTAEPSAETLQEIRRLADEANRSGRGYHVLRPVPGVELAGEYDMTVNLPAFHLPKDLSGLTVLDVGTASGFFAMECVKRGASVTAVDVVLWDTLHWQVAELMGWNIRRVQSDIYALDPSLGTFDVVICGSLLLHLPDPLGAIRRLRTVCGGRAIISTACPEHDQRTGRPTCEFIGEEREGGAYWAYWNIGTEALRRMFIAAGFARVEHEDHFTLRTVSEHEHRWEMLHTVAHGVVGDEPEPIQRLFATSPPAVCLDSPTSPQTRPAGDGLSHDGNRGPIS